MSPRNSVEAIHHMLEVTSCRHIVVNAPTSALAAEVTARFASAGIDIRTTEMPALTDAFPNIHTRDATSEWAPYPPRPTRPDPEGTCLYLHSSGSTGLPKSIALTHTVVYQWFESRTPSLPLPSPPHPRLTPPGSVLRRAADRAPRRARPAAVPHVRARVAARLPARRGAADRAPRARAPRAAAAAAAPRERARGRARHALHGAHGAAVVHRGAPGVAGVVAPLRWCRRCGRMTLRLLNTSKPSKFSYAPPLLPTQTHSRLHTAVRRRPARPAGRRRPRARRRVPRHALRRDRVRERRDAAGRRRAQPALGLDRVRAGLKECAVGAAGGGAGGAGCACASVRFCLVWAGLMRVGDGGPPFVGPAGRGRQARVRDARPVRRAPERRRALARVRFPPSLPPTPLTRPYLCSVARKDDVIVLSIGAPPPCSIVRGAC